MSQPLTRLNSSWVLARLKLAKWIKTISFLTDYINLLFLLINIFSLTLIITCITQIISPSSMSSFQPPLPFLCNFFNFLFFENHHFETKNMQAKINPLSWLVMIPITHLYLDVITWCIFSSSSSMITKILIFLFTN